jgi:hypothetical protein
VEEMEPVWVCCGWLRPPTAHSNQLLLALNEISYPQNIIRFIKWWTWYTACMGEGKEWLDIPRLNWNIKQFNSSFINWVTECKLKSRTGSVG